MLTDVTALWTGTYQAMYSSLMGFRRDTSHEYLVMLYFRLGVEEVSGLRSTSTVK